MKILMYLNGGIGNVMESVPLYLRLKQHLGVENIDVEYLVKYESESVGNAACFPEIVIPQTGIQVMLEQSEAIAKKYDYIISGWRIYHSSGSFMREYEDIISEYDSEVEKNMKCLDALSIQRGDSILREWREKETKIPEGKYIVIHNGGLNAGNWDWKKYPYMEKVAWNLQKTLGIPCISVGKRGEHVPFTEDYTGRSLRETAYIINNALYYVGTDTGTYHIRALQEKPGFVIFTMTSQTKNWDANYHHTIKTIQKDRSELPCCPCQWGYCWSPDHDRCRKSQCRDIDASIATEAILDHMRSESLI